MGKQPEVIKVGAPDWIVTFTDLTSLLTTFFVLLLTFSTMDPQEESSSYSKATGSPSPFDDQMIALQDWMAPPQDPPDGDKGRKDDQEYKEEGRNRRPEGEIVNVGELDEGARYGVQDQRYCFDKGKDNVPPSLMGICERWAQSDARVENLQVIIEGHADKSERNPLGVARRRALAIRRIFLQHGWGEEDVVVRACGTTSPVYTGADASLRKKNRRVELCWVKR